MKWDRRVLRIKIRNFRIFKSIVYSINLLRCSRTLDAPPNSSKNLIIYPYGRTIMFATKYQIVSASDFRYNLFLSFFGFFRSQENWIKIIENVTIFKCVFLFRKKVPVATKLFLIVSIMKLFYFVLFIIIKLFILFSWTVNKWCVILTFFSFVTAIFVVTYQ